jgi:prophage tail gpP-like protein
MVGKASEQAILVVNGQKFRDWETVFVRHALREQPPYHFRFTCSEQLVDGKLGSFEGNFAKLQIKPGDECQIYLAGQLAISGKVSTRQVFYDARRHYIEIQGATWTLDLSGASIVSKTMEYKDVTFDQFARAVLKPFPNIEYKVEGGQTPQMKFPRISIPHGLSVFDSLDLYARTIGISFTSDPTGNFVAIAGPSGGRDEVVEGVNILEGREVIFNPAMETSAPAISQGAGSDKKWGSDVSHAPFLTEEMKNFSKSYMPFAIPMEAPLIDPEHMKGRIGTERKFNAEDQITVFAKVYGWLRPSDGKLWYRDQIVHCKSPMLIMDQDLIAKSVTFTQDNQSGTTTVLELCNELALNGMTPQVQ